MLRSVPCVVTARAWWKSGIAPLPGRACLEPSAFGTVDCRDGGTRACGGGSDRLRRQAPPK
jgi:hypothetical protein